MRRGRGLRRLVDCPTSAGAVTVAAGRPASSMLPITTASRLTTTRLTAMVAGLSRRRTRDHLVAGAGRGARRDGAKWRTGRAAWRCLARGTGGRGRWGRHDASSPSRSAARRRALLARGLRSISSAVALLRAARHQPHARDGAAHAGKLGRAHAAAVAASRSVDFTSVSSPEWYEITIRRPPSARSDLAALSADEELVELLVHRDAQRLERSSTPRGRADGPRRGRLARRRPRARRCSRATRRGSTWRSHDRSDARRSRRGAR